MRVDIHALLTICGAFYLTRGTPRTMILPRTLSIHFVGTVQAAHSFGYQGRSAIFVGRIEIQRVAASGAIRWAADLQKHDDNRSDWLEVASVA